MPSRRYRLNAPDGARIAASFARLRESMNVSLRFPTEVLEDAERSIHEPRRPERDETAIPFVTITVYAGLAQVPRELVEAAEIDGAGPLRVFRDVTFPILKPIFLILTSLSIIWDFGVFTQPYLLIGASHVDSSNYLMGVYVYIEGYSHSDFGRGAAISILMLLIVAALSVVYVRGRVRQEELA